MTMMKADTMVSTSSSPFGGSTSSMMDSVDTVTRNRTLQKQPAQLPQDYTPGNWDVILQRGRECHEHIGNRRFKICVENHVDSYLNAKTRLDKTLVISSVVRSIAGGFIMRVSLPLLTRGWEKPSFVETLCTKTTNTLVSFYRTYMKES